MNDISLINPAEVKGSIFLGCIGYESRSIFCLQKADLLSSAEKIIFDYKCENVFSYSKNVETISNTNCVVYNNFTEFLYHLANTIEKSPAQIIFDITSFDREKIALILKSIFEKRTQIQNVKIVYSPREFVACNLKFEVVNSFGPVIPAFLGDISFSQSGLTLIVGAGYEYGKVIGAVDTLEPNKTVCFFPTGTNPLFDECIERANVNFSFLNDEDLLIKYDVNNAETLYFDLRRLVEFENVSRSVLIIPMGPKIFAAISLLIALIYHPSVKVWRHSTESTSDINSISDAQATGQIIEFAFKFSDFKGS